jgi:hypothetical protein
MANMDVGSWGHSKDVSQSHSSAAIESDGACNSYDPYDDGFDFPPTLHPVRELITFSMFAAGVIALLLLWRVEVAPGDFLGLRVEVGRSRHGYNRRSSVFLSLVDESA